MIKRDRQEVGWALDLLGLEQSREWSISLDALVRMIEPFTVSSLHRRLDIPIGKTRRLITELKKKSIVTDYEIPFPENWDSLAEDARTRRAKRMGLPRGWHSAKYLVFDREKFKQLIYESVENRMGVLLG